MSHETVEPDCSLLAARRLAFGPNLLARNFMLLTFVILSEIPTHLILASPTTEPGRRGWKWRLGSLLSAPHFFVLNASVVRSAAILLT